jgi:putative phosphoesterase
MVFLQSACLIGIISDTHGLLRPEAMAGLQGSDLIIHAGDIGNPSVLDSLDRIAPVFAVRGNNDRGGWAEKIPCARLVKAGEVSLYVLHDLKELNVAPTADTWAAVIAGHSHRPSIQERQGVLFINPGSAGPRRFHLPVTIARLDIRGRELEATIIDLEPGRFDASAQKAGG